VGHVGLGADDGLDALGPAGPVEVEDPVHVAVVGDSERCLAVSSGSGHDFIDPCRTVQHRKLRVDVEVGEVGAHLTPRPAGTGDMRTEPDIDRGSTSEIGARTGVARGSTL